MTKQTELGDQVLRLFAREGILGHIIVVGSWCIYFYRQGFPEGQFLPPLRTTDIEFDVSFLNNLPRTVNLLAALRDLDFLTGFKGDGSVTLVHSEITIEFLVPEKGRGETGPRKFAGFGINAQPLRYLSLLEDDVITVNYKNMQIRVPHPVEFALHKLLISQKRTKPHKAKNDREQGIAVWDMAVRMGHESRIRETFERLKPKWKGFVRAALARIGERERLLF